MKILTTLVLVLLLTGCNSTKDTANLGLCVFCVDAGLEHTVIDIEGRSDEVTKDNTN